MENPADQFDPEELREKFDGWSLYKKNRISFAPVRRYQMMVDQDYKKNKVTVCAHLQNIYNSYVVKRGRPTLQMNNYYDVDKMNNKYAAKINAENSPTKDQKRDLSKIANISPEEPERRTENYLLTKSASTCHIPDNQRA